VLDLGSKEIIGWALSQSPNAQLAKEALTHAIKIHNPDTSQLMFHSDQGVQYSDHLFVNYLKKLKITHSMSRQCDPVLYTILQLQKVKLSRRLFTP
jgi:putative transposase